MLNLPFQEASVTLLGILALYATAARLVALTFVFKKGGEFEKMFSLVFLVEDSVC